MSGAASQKKKTTDGRPAGVRLFVAKRVRSGAGDPDPGLSRQRPLRRSGEDGRRPTYLTSTLAPASSNFFLIVAASSFDTPSLIGLGADSTRSLASLRPRLVTSRTTLIVLILLPPMSVSTTVNSVFSSAAGAAPAAAPPPAGIAIGTAAAAETPSSASSVLTSCDSSSTEIPLMYSTTCCCVTSAIGLLLEKLSFTFERRTSNFTRRNLEPGHPVSRKFRAKRGTSVRSSQFEVRRYVS